MTGVTAQILDRLEDDNLLAEVTLPAPSGRGGQQFSPVVGFAPNQVFHNATPRSSLAALLRANDKVST